MSMMQQIVDGLHGVKIEVQMLAAEVIALVLGLWLMFRTTQVAGEFPTAA
ncbi:MAG: hypothetical protein JZU52_14830 [Lamprocystis purpurea]|nr:hypothetical protein [Lamprocystis purpurea]MBV5274852.1 hypothetical protein [Lamprocystis purpurea]